MTLNEFNTICSIHGKQSLPEEERWKSIKNISVEGIGYPIPFGTYFKQNNSYYLNNDEIGPGFYILEPCRADSSINTERVVTFVPLTEVLAMTFDL